MPDCGSQAPVRRITVKINQSDYSICNRMESVAAEAISQVLLDEVDGCRCPLCQEDMQCYLLNQLEPLYVPVLSEGIGKEMSLQDLAPDLRRRVVSEAYRAVIVVWGSVRHGGERAILHNYTERVVLEALGEALAQEKLDLGREELSMLMADIMNDLPPRYTTSHKGDAFVRTDELVPTSFARVYSAIYHSLHRLGFIPRLG